MSRTPTQNTASNNWRLEALKVVPKGLDPIDIPPQLLDQLVLFEGLSSPTLHGSFIIKDYIGIAEVKQLWAGDEISFSLMSQGVTSPLEFRGRITSSSGITTADQTMPVTKFNFTTEWWFNAITRQISKSWRGVTPEDIMKDVIENECGGTFQGVYPPPDFKFDRFICPYWTPAHVLKHMLDYCRGNGESGYVLYDTLVEQFPVAISTERLRAGDWGESQHELILSTQNPNYAGSVNTFYLEQYYDEMRYLNQGIAQTDWWAFDFDHNKPYKHVGVIDNAVKHHLAAKLPIRNDVMGERYKSVRQSKKWPNTQERIIKPGEAGQLTDIMSDSRFTHLAADLVKINCWVVGDTARSAGQIVQCNFPGFLSKDKNERNPILEGKYMIRDIQHIITPNSFVQAMTICRDGINMMTRDDIHQWAVG